ncbi:MAG: hypothetical protein SPM09_01865 [Fibrobacter sp.]|uniref:hypothetical protein n=1 Tax=Fibrobacter sp. TaxID=35828 RepID=UPI002A90E817|nr:hypothetical protein [Fibrobacter sp.]MDY6263132.1 hypothetical protein [Fibrobacter sp.]
MENELLEQGWSAACIYTGTVKDVISAVQSFARDIEQIAAEHPNQIICADCRAGTSGTFKVRTLADLNADLEQNN